MEPKGSQKAAKIDSKGGPQGFKMEYKCMHFGNASIDFFLLTGATRKRMWALAPKSKNRFSSQCKLPSWKLLPKIASFCVISESCGGSKRKSLTMGALAPICASSIYIYIYIYKYIERERYR